MAQTRDPITSGLFTNGAGHVNLRDTSGNALGIGGSQLYTAILGSSGALVALPSGSGKGPDTYIVDLASFSSDAIYLVVITATGTVTHTADVQYSNDMSTLHPTAADALWGATAGNLEAVVLKKDRYAHVVLTQVIGTAENIWAYVVGRETS